MPHDFPEGSLEERVFDRLQSTIAADEAIAELKQRQMAAYVFSNYLTILVNEKEFENTGYNGKFTFTLLYSVLDALELPNRPTNAQLTDIRKNVEKQYKLLKRREIDEPGSGRSGIYDLPKDESELKQITEFCYELLKKPVMNNHRKKISVPRSAPIYTEKNCDVYYGYESNGAIWFSSEPHAAAAQRVSSLYVAFVPKGQDRLERMDVSSFDDKAYYFAGEKQLIEGRDFFGGKTPAFYIVNKEVFQYFLRNISSFAKFDVDNVTGWSG